MPPRFKQSKAFTLVELMVVVTVIVILLALLIPAMDTAISAGERTKCLAQQRNVAQTSRIYSEDHSGHLPPGVWPDGRIAPSTELRDYNSNTFTPLAWGLLVTSNHLPVAQLAKVIHCPALDTMGETTGVAGWGMDVVHTYGVGGSYWLDPTYATRRLASSYTYRATSYYSVKKMQLKLAQLGSGFVVSADLLDARFSRFHHPFGFNRVFSDASGAFFEDPDREVERIATRTNTFGYIDGVSQPNADEEIFNYISTDR